MDLIDDVDFVGRAVRAQCNCFAEIANIIDACVAGCINFDDVR